MIRKINLEGAEVLTKPCVIISPAMKTQGPLTGALEDPEMTGWPESIHTLVQDLKDTAKHHLPTCLGLAANQIWDKSTACPAIFVMAWPLIEESCGTIASTFQEIINPILETSGPKIKIKERCMSIPGYIRSVSRRSNSTLTFQTLKNIKQTMVKFYLSAGGPYAYVIQHEYDHIQGKLIR